LSVREILSIWFPLIEENSGAFLRYVVSGATTLASYCLVLIALVEVLKIAPWLAAGIATVFAGLINYLLNMWFVFRSDRRHVQAAPRYVGVLAANMGANMAVTWIACDIAGLPYELVQVVYVVVATFTVYLILRRWVMTSGNSAPS
jgi:putative flippase GtrA